MGNVKDEKVVKCTCGTNMITSEKWKCSTSTRSKDFTYALFAQQTSGIIMRHQDDEVLVPDVYVCPECGRVQPVLNKKALDKYKTVNDSAAY